MSDPAGTITGMTWSFGDVTVERVVELDHWEFPASAMFPDVTRALWPHDTVDFSIAAYVVRAPGVTILVDAGNGDGKQRPVLAAHHDFHAGFLDRLAATVPPEEVDIVVCSHLHPDHAGGLTHLIDGRWVPSFPHARHLVPAAELAWVQQLAEQEWPDDRPEADLARTYRDSVEPVLAASLIDVVEVPTVVAPGVTVSPAPGHTAGHVVVEIDVGDEHAVISGDAIHHPFQFADLGVAHAGDADPDAARRSRRDLVERLVARRSLLLPAHFPPGRVVEDSDGGHRYEPV